MNPRHLRPLRERLHHILFLGSALCAICILWILRGQNLYPEYTFAYIIQSENTRWFYLLLALTVLFCGIHFYYQWLRMHITKTGIRYQGEITKVIWKRAFFSGNEWKCYLVISCRDGQSYTSPAYGYELINYLYGTQCEVAVWKKHCYITDLRLMDREMTKEEKKAGKTGSPDYYNSIPDFPILKELTSERHSFHKGYRTFSQRFYLILVIFLICIYTIIFLLSVFTPASGDTDKDGMKDYEEFEIGTDPLTPDTCFPLIKEDETTRIKGQLAILTPYTRETKRQFYFAFTTPIRGEETIAGYIDSPFLLELPPDCTEATLTLELKEPIPASTDFRPQIYKYSYDCQDLGLGLIPVPCQWDGNDSITWNCIDEPEDPAVSWRYYLLDKTAQDKFWKEYDAFWEAQNIQ